MDKTINHWEQMLISQITIHFSLMASNKFFVSAGKRILGSQNLKTRLKVNMIVYTPIKLLSIQLKTKRSWVLTISLSKPQVQITLNWCRITKVKSLTKPTLTRVNRIWKHGNMILLKTIHWLVHLWNHFT